MASTYATRTMGTPTDATKQTMSVWVKLSANDNYGGIVSSQFNSTAGGAGHFTGNNESIYSNWTTNDGGSTNAETLTSALGRDFSGWYHIVSVQDATQSGNDKSKIYINGVLQTNFGNDNRSNFSSHSNWFANGKTLYVGSKFDDTLHFNGIMSHLHLCDGYAYTASDFGSFDSTTGEWKINTSPSVSYGNQGFFIFKDNNSLTDQSGNGNNFSLGSGTITKTEDCPSNVFCTMNPLMVNTSATNTFANGNNTVTINPTDASVGATLGANSGKFYWEQKWTQQGANDRWGVIPDDAVLTNHPRTTGIGWDTASSQFYLLGSAVSGSWGGSIGTSDIIQIALDLDNSALYLGVNGTYRNSGSPTSGSSKTGAVDFSSSSLVGKHLLPACGKGNQDTTTMQYNFGNGYFGTTAVSSAGTNASNIGIFEYDVPAGYTALSTKGINSF